MKNLIKKAMLLLFLMVTISTIASAQLNKKFKKDYKYEGTPTKYAPIITSPQAGSVIDGPFVLVGKAEPNATITLKVTPIYQFSKNTSGKTNLVVSTPAHQPQDFTFIADGKGLWQSPLIEVMFDSKTINRQIFVSASQQWGSRRSEIKMTKYKASPTLTMLIVPIKKLEKSKEENKDTVEPVKDESLIKGGAAATFKINSPTNNRNVGRDDFRISGIAPVDATVKIEVRYWGYKSKSNITIQNFGPIFFPGKDRTTKEVNDALWGTYTFRSVRILNSTSGNFITEVIPFIKKINGYSCWANNYTIKASLINENGELVRSTTINVTRMKTKSI